MKISAKMEKCIFVSSLFATLFKNKVSVNLHLLAKMLPVLFPVL
jgi:hypothetical protein